MTENDLSYIVDQLEKLANGEAKTGTGNTLKLDKAGAMIALIKRAHEFDGVVEERTIPGLSKGVEIIVPELDTKKNFFCMNLIINQNFYLGYICKNILSDMLIICDDSSIDYISDMEEDDKAESIKGKFGIAIAFMVNDIWEDWKEDK